MAKLSRPRFGSLQFWPRKRAQKALPRVNWSMIKTGNGLAGFISYKVGMGTALVRDKTDKSMTINKKIAMPVTVLEVPPMKLFSIRFYKNGIVMKEVIVSTDKELKRKVKLPKNIGSVDGITGWDEIRVIMYPVLRDLFKKTPDFTEIAVRHAQPLEFVKGLIGKEINLKDLLTYDLIDARGLTTGKGLVGPVKRFGISLKSHKSEKGVRRPGSLGPWHPARVTFRTPMAGQLGMFSRITYNLKVVAQGSIKEKNINRPHGFPHYGSVSTDYIIVAGSVQGPPKRQLIITPAMRPTKKHIKEKFEFMELK